MSAQEVKALKQGGQSQLRVGRLRSGCNIASEPREQTEEAVGQLQTELEQALAELHKRNQELEETRGEVTRLQSELRTLETQFELDQLRGVEQLRQEMDLERRHARREREELLAERAASRKQLESHKARSVRSGHVVSTSVSTGVLFFC